MVKKNLLRGKIAEKETNYIECSKAINVTKTTFSKKMNGHTDFSVEQASLLSDYLGLTQSEKIDIFLS